MKETNAQKLAHIEKMDYDTIMETYHEDICKICDTYIEKNLSPTNPCCEGSWCEEALDYFMEELSK